MKTLIITGIAIFFAVNSISAQTEAQVKSDIKTIDKKENVLKSKKKKDKITLRKLEGKEASFQSKQQFVSDFGNIPNVAWTRNGYFDEAIFTKDGKQTKAYYDADAQLVGTVNPAQFSDLPAAAQKHIQKDFKDYAIDKVIFYDDNEANDDDMLLYGSQFEDEDSYFVEASGHGKKIILHVTQDGNVYYFSEIK